MKNAFSKFYNYLIALGAACVPTLIGFACYFGINDIKKWPLVFVGYTMMFGGVIILGGGFIAQDIYRGRVRHNIGDWDNKLDQKYLDKAWAIFCPLLLGGATAIIAGFILYLFVR